MMDRTSIEKRKEQLQRQLKQAEATANAIGGAIQDCDYWLKECDKATAAE